MPRPSVANYHAAVDPLWPQKCMRRGKVPRGRLEARTTSNGGLSAYMRPRARVASPMNSKLCFSILFVSENRCGEAFFLANRLLIASCVCDHIGTLQRKKEHVGFSMAPNPQTNNEQYSQLPKDASHRLMNVHLSM